MCWERPSQGTMPCLEGRVGSSQVAQEVPFELHLSDMMRGRGEDLGAQPSGES